MNYYSDKITEGGRNTKTLFKIANELTGDNENPILPSHNDPHHHLRVIKLVFSIFPHISLLYRWTCWGHPMSRAVQDGCIASRVRCSLLPDRTHKSYLLRSTAISVSVPCYMWILYVVDSGFSTLSMVCQILLLNFRLCWQWLCVVLPVIS